jgi:hypothetical protein
VQLRRHRPNGSCRRAQGSAGTVRPHHRVHLAPAQRASARAPSAALAGLLPRAEPVPVAWPGGSRFVCGCIRSVGAGRHAVSHCVCVRACALACVCVRVCACVCACLSVWCAVRASVHACVRVCMRVQSSVVTVRVATLSLTLCVFYIATLMPPLSFAFSGSSCLVLLDPWAISARVRPLAALLRRVRQPRPALRLRAVRVPPPCARAHARARACMRVCARARVPASARVRVRACVHVCVRACVSDGTCTQIGLSSLRSILVGMFLFVTIASILLSAVVSLNTLVPPPSRDPACT